VLISFIRELVNHDADAKPIGTIGGRFSGKFGLGRGNRNAVNWQANTTLAD
jgi:hypothetical protein